MHAQPCRLQDKEQRSSDKTTQSHRKPEMSTTCKHRISWWWTRNVLKFRAHQHVSCSFHIFPMQSARGRRRQYRNTWLTLWKCCTLVRFRHQNYLVMFRKRFRWWKSCVWPIQTPNLLHLQTLSCCWATDRWQKMWCRHETFFPIEICYSASRAGCNEKHWQFLSVYINL